jgi:hypothetical protein
MSLSFDHVRWIGGTSCSGKTTYAQMLVRKHHLQLYQCDEHQEDHLKRATPDKHPTLYAAWQTRADWDTWYRQSPQTMLDLSRREAYEAFGLLLDDITEMPCVPAIVVEGIGLYPELLGTVSLPGHAIMFVADAALARKTWEDRYRHTQWLDGYSNPQEIVENFIQWTRLSAEYIQDMARQCGITCYISTPETCIPEVFEAIESYLGYT